MKKALLLVWLLCPQVSAQPRQIVENLLQGRPQVENQIDWTHLSIDNAPDLPRYSDLSQPQQAAFRKAVLTTLASRHGTTAGLQPRRQGTTYYLEKPGLQFTFEGNPLRLTAIRFPK